MRRALLATRTVARPPVVVPQDPIYARYSTAMPNQHAAIIRVGQDRPIKTVTDGIAAANNAISGTHRGLVVLDPGQYDEQVWTYPRVDVAGATGDPSDVVIQHPCPTGFSPINTTGGPIWLGGLTARLLDYPNRTGTGVYSIHHHGGALTIFERVDLDAPDAGGIGMDGDAGSATWLIGCTFLNYTGRTDQATNMHGSPGNALPLRLVFDGCQTNGLGVNYNSLDSGQMDRLWVVGGSVAAVNVAGSATRAVIDPAVPTVGEGAGAVVTRGTTLPDRPIRGA